MNRWVFGVKRPAGSVRVPLGALAVIMSLACGAEDGDGGGAVGSPCNVDEDCRSDLICDIHGGRGSCQEPHDHGEAEDDAAP